MKERLTHGSLFAGIEGFALAAREAGIETRWSCEIEPYCRLVINARFPNVVQYGDIRKLDGGEVAPVDIITFGSPCFPAGTLVLTERGYLPIEDLQVGDRVLSHTGKWRKVTATGCKTAKTIQLKGGYFGLETTHNHPIYSAQARTTYSRREDGKRTAQKALAHIGEWTHAEHMQGKQWATPNEVEPLPIPQASYHSNKQKELPSFDEKFFYFIGRWLGDGWVRDEQRNGRPAGQCNGQMYLCDSSDKEDEIIAAVQPLSENYCVFREGTVSKVRFCSTALCEWLTQNFGKGAADKTIPGWVFGLPIAYRAAIMKGLEESDGHLVSDGHLKISTVSKKLALGIRTLGETLGYATSVNHCERPATCVIEGRTVNQKSTYTVSLTLSERKYNTVTEGHTWYKCRKVTETGESKVVYNISVDVDESYIADSIVVHNCQSFSQAGARQGLDGASGLFYEAVRVIREMRSATHGQHPKYAVMENVPGIYSSKSGGKSDFREVLNELLKIADQGINVPEPLDGKFLTAGSIVGEGCSLAWRTLCASKFGVAQRRRRMFLVVSFADQRAGEILSEPEGEGRDFTPSYRKGQGAAGSAAAGFGSVVAFEPGALQRIDKSAWEDQARTIRAHMGDNQTAVAYAYPLDLRNATRVHDGGQGVGIGKDGDSAFTVTAEYPHGVAAVENHPSDSRLKICEDGLFPTISAKFGTGGGNTHYVLAEREKDVPVLCLEGNGQRPSHKGSGIKADEAFTLDTIQQHAVCYQETVGALCASDYRGIRNQDIGDNKAVVETFGNNGFGKWNDEVATLKANGGDYPGGENLAVENHYAVRRLTPLECLRLQGLPDWWLNAIHIETPTEEQLAYWRAAWAQLGKRKTDNQLRKWLANPYGDSPAYKAIGNSLAVPCALFVMRGIADQFGK